MRILRRIASERFGQSSTSRANCGPSCSAGAALIAEFAVFAYTSCGVSNPVSPNPKLLEKNELRHTVSIVLGQAFDVANVLDRLKNRQDVRQQLLVDGF